MTAQTFLELLRQGGFLCRYTDLVDKLKEEIKTSDDYHQVFFFSRACSSTEEASCQAELNEITSQNLDVYGYFIDGFAYTRVDIGRVKRALDSLLESKRKKAA